VRSYEDELNAVSTVTAALAERNVRMVGLLFTQKR
jgi:hypothetical protein